MTEPVNDVLIAYGETDITRITGLSNIAKLRAIAKVHALKIARRRASVLYNFADGSQRLDRAAIFDHIAKELAEAESELGSLGIGPGASVVRISTVTWPQDPYGPFNPIASGDE